MRTTTGITIFGSAIFIPVLLLGLLQIGLIQGMILSPTMHLFTILVVVVAALFFWHYAVHSFQVTGSFRVLMIALGLLVGGLLLFAHGLFDLVENDMHSDRAIWYLQLATLISSLLLLVAVGFDERIVAARHRTRLLRLVTLLVVVGVGASMMIAEAAMQAGISAMSSLGHWTPTGRFLQVAAILFFTIAGIRYLYGAFLARSETALAFATGSVLLVAAELNYAISLEQYDVYFWVFHLWYMMGYVAFVWGGYTARVSHHEMEMAPSENKMGFKIPRDRSRS